MGFRQASAGLALAVLLAACKSVPVAPIVTTPEPPPPVPLDRRAAWIVRLEQQRMLRDVDVSAPEGVSAARAPVPARVPDLVALLRDTDVGVRRRAALAIGRVGRVEGVEPLTAALHDDEADVRAQAAFALGLIGVPAGVAPLTAALKDASPVVRGRAAEGLGLIGDSAAAPAVADAAAGCGARFAGIEPDDETIKEPEVEACRLTLFALVRLKQYDQLARVALDDRGQPASRWWPIAFALQRIADKRAAPALLVLASSDGVYTPAFALRGLAAAGDRQLIPPAQALATRVTADLRLRVAAVRALGQVGGPASVDLLARLMSDRLTPPNLALEAATGLGAIGDAKAFDSLVDQFTHPWPAMRSAALASAAKVNPDGFLLLAAAVAADSDWSVRAQIAPVLATLPPDRVRSALEDLANEQDARVRAPALRALAKVGAPDLTKRLFDALEAPDFTIRATAADLIGESKPDGGVARLSAAYMRGESDAAYGARGSALSALSKYATDDATAVLRRALDDKEWPVRWRAAELLRALGAGAAVPAVPAPIRQPPEYFESAALLHPVFSPHAFIETRYGTIEFELNVVDAPVTSQNFVDLARAGFFNGIKVHRVVPNFVVQAGDPRGDGEGGPGFTIRDELSPLPYVRGTVGMALDWRDTGGSQFFITVSPQPHLDAKYTVFGRVVKGGDVLDQLSQWDLIERVRIWDGVKFQ